MYKRQIVGCAVGVAFVFFFCGERGRRIVVERYISRDATYCEKYKRRPHDPSREAVLAALLKRPGYNEPYDDHHYDPPPTLTAKEEDESHPDSAAHNVDIGITINPTAGNTNNHKMLTQAEIDQLIDRHVMPFTQTNTNPILPPKPPHTIRTLHAEISKDRPAWQVGQDTWGDPSGLTSTTGETLISWDTEGGLAIVLRPHKDTSREIIEMQPLRYLPEAVPPGGIEYLQQTVTPALRPLLLHLHHQGNLRHHQPKPSDYYRHTPSPWTAEQPVQTWDDENNHWRQPVRSGEISEHLITTYYATYYGEELEWHPQMPLWIPHGIRAQAWQAWQTGRLTPDPTEHPRWPYHQCFHSECLCRGIEPPNTPNLSLIHI